MARAAAAEKPELAEKLRMPRGRTTEAAFRCAARTVLAEAQANQDLLLKYGMWDGALDELTGRLAEYDRASFDGHSGRALHTGARAELSVLAKELLAMVKQLEGMMLIRFRQDPNLRGAWASARNVAWPKPAATEAPASGSNQDVAA